MNFLAVLLMVSSASYGSIDELYGNKSVSHQDKGANYAPQVALSVDLKVKKSTSVSSAFIYLSDVAECVGLKSLCSEVNQVLVSDSPLPSKSRRISRSSIESLVRNEFPKQNFVIKGSADSLVNAEAISIDESRLRESIENELNQILGSNTLKIEITNINLRRSTYVRPGVVRFSLLESNQFENWFSSRKIYRQISKKISVKVSSLFRGDESSIILPVVTRLKFSQLVPVAIKTMRPGQLIHSDSIDYQWHPLQKRVIKDSSEIVGLRLKKTVREGKFFKKNYLESPVVIRRGQQVQVAIKNGHLSLTGKGKALASAKIGDVIQVKLAKTNKSVKGKVTASGKVEVVR